MCYAMYNGRVYFSPIYDDGGIVAVSDSFFYRCADFCFHFGCVPSHIDSESGIVGGDFDSVVA